MPKTILTGTNDILKKGSFLFVQKKIHITRLAQLSKQVPKGKYDSKLKGKETSIVMNNLRKYN